MPALPETLTAPLDPAAMVDPARTLAPAPVLDAVQALGPASVPAAPTPHEQDQLWDAVQNEQAAAQPRCKHFGYCGGCQLQDISEPMQLLMKRNTMDGILQASGLGHPAIHVHSAEPYHYRNRVRLRVENGTVGYSRRKSNEFLPVEECPIATPLLWQTASLFQSSGRDGGLWPDRVTELELVSNNDSSAMQALLHLDTTVATLDREAPARFRALCTAVAAAVPQLVGAGLLVQGPIEGNTRRVQQRQRIEVARWGSPDLTYRIRGVDYVVSRGAFFQVNRFLTRRMVDLVAAGRTGRTAWDLFAGAGLFSVPLTHGFQQVTAVEVGQPAASDLLRALQKQGPQHRAVAQPVAAFLAAQTRAPDLIVMDPPRAGLGRDIVQQLIRLGAPRIVFISCDLQSFARDARALVDSRYAVTELHLLDLFPQTIHTETIAVLERS